MPIDLTKARGNMRIYQVEVIANINREVIEVSDLYLKRESAEKERERLTDMYFDPKDPDTAIVIRQKLVNEN